MAFCYSLRHADVVNWNPVMNAMSNEDFVCGLGDLAFFISRQTWMLFSEIRLWTQKTHRGFCLRFKKYCISVIFRKVWILFFWNQVMDIIVFWKLWFKRFEFFCHFKKMWTLFSDIRPWTQIFIRFFLWFGRSGFR